MAEDRYSLLMRDGLFEPPLTETQKKQGAVLAHAHFLLTQNKGMMTIGDAIKQAVAQGGVHVPQDIQDTMAVVLFKLAIKKVPYPPPRGTTL